MKRRLFAAAMAMTMVMASSIPTLAYTIEDSTNNSSTKSQELDLNAIIHDRSGATTGSIEQRDGDKVKNVWAVDISANDLTYNIYRTPTTEISGYKEYKWNATTHSYDNDETNARTNPVINLYSFTENEEVDNNGRAKKQFSIENHSNFNLSASFYTSSDVTGVDASQAFSTSDTIYNLATANSDVGYVYLDLAGIHDSLTYTNEAETKIGKLTINLTAGAREN